MIVIIRMIASDKGNGHKETRCLRYTIACKGFMRCFRKTESLAQQRLTSQYF